MTELLFGADGVWGPDIAARINHQASIDVFETRGGKTPRQWPAPRVTEIDAGDVIEGGAWRVTVGRAAHVQPWLECLAFRFDCDEGSVCYSGDSGGECGDLIELARGCDVLIAMNHYYSGTEPTAAYREACGNHRDNAAIARAAGVKTLVLSHVLAHIDRPGIRERIVQEVREVFDGTVVWGEDLMEIPVGGVKLTRSE
jgi:ribonuclease BN (tRNA processing enzyme)